MIDVSKSIGVGINYRKELSQQIFDNIDIFDCLEVNTESLFDDSNHSIDRFLNILPIILHGLTLSIGTASEDIPSTYLENLRKAVIKTNCSWYSEHLAITNIKGIDLRTLMPVDFTESNVSEIVRKIKKIKDISKKDFLLENIAYYYPMPNSDLSESEFISKIIIDADCGMLLDLNNIYVNAVNHEYDPYKFIDSLPLDRVVEVHVAGCSRMKGLMVDTHASRVSEEVISLFKYLHKKSSIQSVIIERDDRNINFQEILDEVALFKTIVKNG